MECTTVQATFFNCTLTVCMEPVGKEKKKRKRKKNLKTETHWREIRVVVVSVSAP